MCAYGVTEPGAGSDVAGIKTKAEKKVAEIRLYRFFALFINSVLGGRNYILIFCSFVREMIGL